MLLLPWIAKLTITAPQGTISPDYVALIIGSKVVINARVLPNTSTLFACFDYHRVAKSALTEWRVFLPTSFLGTARSSVERLRGETLLTTFIFQPTN